jgi:hypothetical protein
MISKNKCILQKVIIMCALALFNAVYSHSDSVEHVNSRLCSIAEAGAIGKDESDIHNRSKVQSLHILGLVNPAAVVGSISVSLAEKFAKSSITYCLDGKPIWISNRYPYRLGSEQDYPAKGFSLNNISPGEHRLQAVAVLPDGTPLLSNQIDLSVVPTMNDAFNQSLSVYPLQSTVQQPLAAILEHTATPDARLTREEMQSRYQVASMYLNFGIDLSLDYKTDQSKVMTSLLPSSWASSTYDTRVPLSMQFSPDAPYYHPIPIDWPHVRLPRGYIKTIQLNTSRGGDGIGYGVAIAQNDSTSVPITSMWYSQEDTRKVFEFRVPRDWIHSLPTLEVGDRHMIFVDPVTKSFVSSYKTAANKVTGYPSSLYTSSPTPLNSLGDHGGSTSSGFAELPILIQPGEATSDEGGIHHAIGGPVSRPWAARVYPATSRDYNVLTSTNSCTGKGKTNNGLVPYGGIIQLDPSIDLTKLKLSRPALRILQAMQTYGYYVMDFGCSDLDIYTSISEKELWPYGGLYGISSQLPGVQVEIANIITMSDLYVVPPLVKRP